MNNGDDDDDDDDGKKHCGMFSQKKRKTKQKKIDIKSTMKAFSRSFNVFNINSERFFFRSLFTLSSNRCCSSALIFGTNSCLMQIDSKMLSSHEWNWRSDVSLLTASIYQISIEIPRDDLVCFLPLWMCNDTEWNVYIKWQQPRKWY